jgi:hypothetical protein
MTAPAANGAGEYELLTPKNRSYNGTNFPVMRYSDVLLMKAEAENAVNGPTTAAYDALNQVRRRAYEKPLTAPDAVADAPAGLSKDDFFAYVVDERSRELCFEGIRKHDMVRWGTYITGMKALAADITATAPSNYKFAAKSGDNMTARNVVFPIPNSEVTANHLVTQNPGW